jgi:hypothetical protein
MEATDGLLPLVCIEPHFSLRKLTAIKLRHSTATLEDAAFGSTVGQQVLAGEFKNNKEIVAI